MRIAIVNKFFFLKGGQETVALEQMKLLEQAGHAVAFFSMHHPSNPKHYYWSKYFVDYADFSLREPMRFRRKAVLAARFVANTQAARRFDAFLDEFKPDLIHCHGLAHQLTYAILPKARKRNIPVIQTLHDYQIICPNYTLLQGDHSICTAGCSGLNFAPCIRNRCVKGSLGASVLSSVEMFYNRGLFNYAPAIHTFISPSRFLAEKVIASGIGAHKFVQIPNFLNGLDEIIPSFSDDGYFLYVGRLSYEKGLMTLLEAFRERPSARLRLVGDGPLRESLMTYCRQHCMTQVEFLGHQDHATVSSLIRGAMAIILPSEWYENQPMSIVEAFAHGKPVIASHIGGIPEMVLEGYNGRLFPPGDGEALSRIIDEVSKDKESLRLMGSNARSWAVEHYHSTRHLRALTRLYREVACVRAVF